MNEKVSFFKKISNFFKEVKQEFVNRTTWPSRELLINSFVTILIFIVFWAVLIGLFDYVFAYLLKLITSI
jgi:preprotein translocase SecE subunit